MTLHSFKIISLLCASAVVITVSTPAMAQENLPVPNAQELKTPMELQGIKNKEALNKKAAVSTIDQVQDVLKETANSGDNTFYDSNDVVATGQMGSQLPRKMNPRKELASTLVVVEENSKSNSKQASLVAAERAMKLGLYDSATEIYDRLYAQNGSDPNILIGRASALHKLNRTDEAIEMYDRLLDLRPDNLDAQINMLGLMSGKYPAVALRRLMELREKHPNNAIIAAQIAVVNSRVGNYQDAIQYLGLASSLEPNNPLHLYNMGIIADRSGAKKQAIKYYEDALDVDVVYGGGRTIPRDVIFDRLAKLR